MAKRVVKWFLKKASETATVETILAISKALEDPKATAVIEAEFDLVKLYPGFAEMPDVQRQLIIYGTKQKLMDTGASEVADAKGKIGSAKETWDELIAGKWKGERVNSTGAAETKKNYAAIKDLAKAETMQGLLIKQALANLPGNPPFTEEDAKKLDEFLKIAARGGKK